MSYTCDTGLRQQVRQLRPSLPAWGNALQWDSYLLASLTLIAVKQLTGLIHPLQSASLVFDLRIRYVYV